MIIENFKDDKEALRAMTGELVRYMDRKDDGLPFNLALSGGGTAQKTFALWVDEYKDKIDWDAIRFFWVDERCAPHSWRSGTWYGSDALFACRERVSAPARAITLF